MEYRKHFIPLESNPDVFTDLINKLGVSEKLCFQDVWSLENADELAFVPRPVYGLILVFPTTPSYEARVEEEDAGLEDYEGGGEGRVMFFKQTINNACGLYAIIHAVCNGLSNDQLTPESTIARLKGQGSLLGPEDCALAMEGDPELEKVYTQVAQTGDTEAPDDPEEEVDYHYICFVKTQDNHLYQLDGDRKRPIDLGSMAADEDVLSDKCLDVIRAMIKQEEGDVHFSLMALVPSDQ